MEPYYDDGQIVIYCADCQDVLPALSEASFDLLCTDPPYGIRKADWDGDFPTFWLDHSARVTRSALAIMPGVNNLLRLPSQIGLFEYRWMLSVLLSNGMTRGLLGFGNWIPCAVYGRPGVSLYRAQQDATAIPISGDMPDHPSPKPLRAMTWLLSRFEAESVIDPFLGSGTTLVAAKWLGMKAVGIEREERYCEIAVKRLAQSVMPLEVA